MFIYWSLASLGICFRSTYRVITVAQTVLFLTEFILHVCLLIKLPPSFLFRISELMKDGKKRENSSKCFTHDLGKT